MTGVVVVLAVSVMVAAAGIELAVDGHRRAAATNAVLRLTRAQRDGWRQEAIWYQAALRHEFRHLQAALPAMRVSAATAGLEIDELTAGPEGPWLGRMARAAASATVGRAVTIADRALRRPRRRVWAVPAAAEGRRRRKLLIEVAGRADQVARLAALGVELDPPDCPGTHRFAPILATDSATCPECGVVVGLEIAPDGGAGPVIGRHPATVWEGER